MRSALYSGWVRHRRLEPRSHEFRRGLFMLCLDLDELDEVFAGRWLWSVERPNVASFRRADYLGDPDVPLAAAVRDRVEEHLGRRPTGRIELVTHLRHLGYCFNPVSFYYCRDPRTDAVESIVAEITNTPWNERHAYVLDARGGAAERPEGPFRFRFDKAFHVSPFMAMDQQYVWTFGEPAERLAVHMENLADGRRIFDATLSLERRPISGRSLASALLRHPAMTASVWLGIHVHAARLWLKRVPFHPHPDTRS